MKRSWIGTIYYYLAAFVGLVMLIGGAVGFLQGLRQAALPTASDEYSYRSVAEPRWVEGEIVETPSPAEVKEQKRAAASQLRKEGLNDAFGAAIFAAVGAPVFFWHIRRAREREEDPPPDPASD